MLCQAGRDGRCIKPAVPICCTGQLLCKGCQHRRPAQVPEQLRLEYRLPGKGWVIQGMAQCILDSKGVSTIHTISSSYAKRRRNGVFYYTLLIVQFTIAFDNIHHEVCRFFNSFG